MERLGSHGAIFGVFARRWRGDVTVLDCAIFIYSIVSAGTGLIGRGARS